MEMTCNRCHQTLQAENSYCPACGMPQLLYAADASEGQTQPAHWDEAAPDAATIQWKPALRAAMLMAVPAAMLSSGVIPVGYFGVFQVVVIAAGMAAAASWAVVLYMRSQRPAWMTAGAGARLGLITGILAGWLGFGLSGLMLFIQRALLHHGNGMDTAWKAQVALNQQFTQSWTSGMSAADAAQMQASSAQVQALMLSPWGHAGFVVFSIALNAAFLLLFAAAGGALKARSLARARRPGI